MNRRNIYKGILSCMMTAAILSGCQTKATEDELNKYRKTESEVTASDESLSTEENNLKNYEQAGVLKIDAVDIEIPIISVNDIKEGEEDKAQKIADEENSAVFFKYGEQYLICSSEGGGFKNLRNVKADTTTAEIEWSSGETVTYLCTKTEIGQNYNNHITDETDTNIAYANEGGITIYTYGEEEHKVFLTFWQKNEKN